ncbi:hypothetical protein ACJMK2_023676 [Sinanodonta woodiana]|uniref:Peroxisomal carnitine O-octanoyltransferase n=1 Tax=Sinanodonta woodiana TaxID=1069815 RepID=A0ABD3T512_SINWO
MDPDVVFVDDKEKTFDHENDLPSLPIPSLEHTLERYIDSVKPHLTDDEFRRTQFIVQQFASGIGKDLHFKLLEKAKYVRNWLEKWWEDVAYLEFRSPIAPLVNFGGPGPYLHNYMPPQDGTQIERAAFQMHYYLKFVELVRTEKLRKDRDSKGHALCMNQFKRAFCTYRIPGVQKDQLYLGFKTESEGSIPNHLIVLCRGRIYVMEVYHSSGEPYTVPELQKQLQMIREQCDNRPIGPGIGALTGDNRTSWAKLRNRLIALNPVNYENLRAIESSIYIQILDDASPTDESDIFYHSLAGDSTNRWFDKATSLIAYKNGVFGSNCDHTPVDAMVLVASIYYCDLSTCKYKGKWQGKTEVGELPAPRELVFQIDNTILEGIQNAKQVYSELANNLQCSALHFTSYGKTFLRSHNLHPDTHVQLSLQFAYYRTYKRPAPTYETATTRKFYHGRTETLRACTTEAIDWSKAMLNPNTSDREKVQLYMRAMDKHNRLMAEGTEMRGCDRHLLGMYMIAREEGLPVPLLYQDEAYTKSGGNGNFILSTSFVGYTSVYGGVAPMCEKGYGTFYRIEPNKIATCVTAWNSCPETDAVKFNHTIHQCLSEMGKLLQTVTDTGARL